jgi:hypothetical protein
MNREEASPGKASNHKPSFEEDFANWCEDEYKKPPSALGKALRSREFVRWYLRGIHNLSSTPQVDEDSLDEGIVDRSGDIGNDYVFRDAEENQVLIIQAKYRDGKSPTESDDDIPEFGDLLSRLRDKNGAWIRTHAHEGIREFAQSIDWSKDSITLIYLTNAQASDRALTAFATAKKRMESEHQPTTVHFHYRSELNSLFRQVRGDAAPLPGNIEFYFEKLLPFGNSCVAIVPGHQIAEMYAAGGKLRLFTENIRNHLGQTRINVRMAQTIKEEPGDFYFYNNGISCIATSFEVDETKRLIRAVGLQVINGAQTVKTLADAKADGDDAALRDEVRVLVRITERGLRGSDNRTFYENIIRYNNSQNAIKEQDFANRDPVQKSFADHFKKLKRKDKQVVYGLRRGDTPRLAEVVPVTMFGQRVLAFLASPIAAGNSVAKLFDRDGEHYRLVFCAGDENATVISNEEFAVRAGIWWLSVEFQKLQKEDKASGRYGAAVDNLPLILWASKLMLERSYGTDSRKLLIEASPGNWSIDGATELEGRFRLLYECSRAFLFDDFGAQRDNASEAGRTFKPNEWRRARATYERLAKRAGSYGLAENLTMRFPI